MCAEIREASADQLQLQRALIDAGILIETPVLGVYGHGAVFERIRVRLGEIISAEGLAQGAERMQFPPVISKVDFEDSGYLGNFPHLAGSVFSFDGGEREARDLAERGAAHEDWSEFETQTDMAMVPAACYSVYPQIAKRGTLPEGGALVDIGASWVFRHEPSQDPARRQLFQMHELVRIAEPDVVDAWRTEWIERGTELLRSFGLDASIEAANDPFFGRVATILAANQREQQLKLELVIPITEPEPTACASFNRHLDHLTGVWGIKTADGNVAHSGCAAFGHERIVLALLKTHGFEPEQWPADVRSRLWD